MSLDLSGRKSGEQGSRIRPCFANRNWQDGPVVRAGRGPQPEPSQVIVTDCLTGTSVSAGKRCKTAPSLADVFHHKPAQTGTDLHKEISMDDEIDIQDLDAYEIRELLLDQGSEVDEEQAAAIKQFIEDIGGLENALAAVDLLDGLQKAA
jgi:hypothetical protein